MTVPSPDSLFVKFLRSGDPEHFAVLHDLLRDELLRVAQRLAPDRASAEDLVQATFLGALESAGRFDRSRKVMPWLVGILQNQARAMRWRQSRVPDRQRVLWPEPRDPAELAADREFAVTLATAFERLGPTYAPVLELHLRENLSAQDIAARLDRPAGTVRTQVVRGAAMLRGLLPAGLGALLLVRVTPGLDGAGVRTLLVDHAARGQVAAISVGLPKSIVMAVAALLVVAMAWLVVPAWFRLDRAPSSTLDGPAPEVAARTRDVPVATAALATTRPSEPTARELVAQSAIAALTVVVTTGGVPVPAVPVQVVGVDDPRFRRTIALTGADGRASLPALPAGRWLVTPLGERAARAAALVELVAGGSVEHSIALDSALVLDGRAVDERGAPIPGAEVWLCDGDYEVSFGFGAQRVLIADGDGRFTLATGGRHNLQTVQLTAPDRRASTLQRLPRERGEQQSFVLSANGGCVQGIVVDSSGAAVGGVLVRARHAGSGDDRAHTGPDGATVRSDTLGAIREVTTEADGAFRIEGFDRGREVVVRVCGADWARAEQRVAAGGPPVTVTLQRGALIHGRVVDAGGAPVADAEVAAEPDDPHDPVTARVRTGSDGRYELSGVTPGDAVALRVTSRPDPHGRGGAGNASTALRLQPGQRMAWDPTLVSGDVVHGRLTSSDGRVLASWEVTLVAVDRAGGRDFQTKTDNAGAFTLRNVPSGRYWLQPTLPPRDGHGFLGVKYVVTLPSAGALDLVVPAPIVQNILDWRPPDSAAAVPMGTLEVHGLDVAKDDVSFYVFPVEPSRTWYCLDWKSARGCHSQALPPGSYRLVVFSTQWSRGELATADQVHDVTITAGQSTIVRPTLRPGVRRCFRIDEPWSHLCADMAFAEVRDSTGGLVSRWIVPRFLEPAPGTFEASVALAPGRYRITVETDLGHRGEVAFSVDGLVPCPDVVSLPVR